MNDEWEKGKLSRWKSLHWKNIDESEILIMLFVNSDDPERGSEMRSDDEEDDDVFTSLL